MKTIQPQWDKGIALVCVISVLTVVILIGFGLLSLVSAEVFTVQREVRESKAFYLAEAGIAELAANLNNNQFSDISPISLGEGTYQVTIYTDSNSTYAISTGTVGNTVERIKVVPSFLSGIYEKAVHAGNGTDTPFVFTLRGTGDPIPVGFNGDEYGGADQIHGDIYVNGDVSMYEASSVNPAPQPNVENLTGDVDATGAIAKNDSSSISGKESANVPIREDPDLVGMAYEANNTHNVSQIFAEYNIDGGRLPPDHELYNVIEKNPVDRSNEIGSTADDDYFLEPAVVTGVGNQKNATTSLDLGKGRIYYVDGDLWIHNKHTYGFLVDGLATIVATGDIHISDNIEYANDESLLGLVALGKYDDAGNLVSGGNIYFGDPRYGTTYTVSGLMFAAHDFLYNTDSITGGSEEPQTGFSVFGNFAALNQVSVNRDWYTDGHTRKPALFDTSIGTWVDLNDKTPLTPDQINSLKHYQMKINYDARVRIPETQPPGLPRGPGSIFAGLISWEEIP